MKPLRIVYLTVLLASLGLSSIFYYKYQLKGSVLAQYRNLSQVSNEVLKAITAELAQSKKDLEESLQEAARLNKTIASLEKEKTNFKGKVQALKKERERLRISIALLLEQKTVLEKKFHSLKELRKAIRITRIGQRHKRKLERIQKRLAKIEMLSAMDRAALKQGNQGYLVKNTQPTFRPTRITVELEPVNKWSYRRE
ncbi:MAG: hypothetical protein NG712_03200 [Omnitrophica bacterium]|nr:hypothetical protein [Candidatus Omnitrophota bacterium]